MKRPQVQIINVAPGYVLGDFGVCSVPSMGRVVVMLRSTLKGPARAAAKAAAMGIVCGMLQGFGGAR